MGCGQSTQRNAAPTSGPRAVSTDGRRSSLSSTHRAPVPARTLTRASSTSQNASAPVTQPRSGARALKIKEPRRWQSSAAPPPAILSTHSPTTIATDGPIANTRWTTSLLARERVAFFDTRVTGRPEIWQAIQLAVELARDSHDLKGAAGILEAAGCTVQRSRLEEGVWDDRGALYEMPLWVVSDPTDVIVMDTTEVADGEATEAEDNGIDEGDAVLEGKETLGQVPLGEETVLEEKSEKKGKGKEMGAATGTEILPATKDAIKVRARLSDRGTDVVVMAEKDENVKVVVRRIQEKAEMTPQTKVRLLYMGRMLNENAPLVSQGWQPGHVVNALVFT